MGKNIDGLFSSFEDPNVEKCRVDKGAQRRVHQIKRIFIWWTRRCAPLSTLHFFIFAIVFLNPTQAISQTIPHYSIQQYDETIKQLYQHPKTQSNDVATRIIKHSEFFLGTHYLEGALGEGPIAQFDQSPLYRTDAFDCTTYVSTVLALVEGRNLQQFKNNIKKINYHGNKINYENRNHFIELDWNKENQKNGYLTDITDHIGHHITEVATTMIDKPIWYRMKTIDSIKYLNSISPNQSQSLLEKLRNLSSTVNSQIATISYIPLQKLFNSDGSVNQQLFDQIPSGSIIELVGPSWSLKPWIGTDLLVVHMGIVIRHSQELLFREASSEKRLVMDVPLVDYLRGYLNQSRSIKGINIQKIKINRTPVLMKIKMREIIYSMMNSKRHLIILLLGFSSGLPAALTASTLQAWFTEEGINLQKIGAVTLLVFPYSFRFLWASIFDHYAIPRFDRRRGWLYVTQIGLMAAIIVMAFLTPHQDFKLYSWNIPWLMLVGFLTAFLSSSQDIAIGAYQIEFLPKEEQGLGAAIYGIGWRVSSIISGAIALLLAKYWGWRETYLFMASLMSIGIVATYIAPNAPYIGKTSKTIVQATIVPLKEFFQRYGLKTAFIFLLIIITYKAGDALALALNTTFLLRQMGFDLATVGIVNKSVSIASSILGGVIAGVLITRMSLYRGLMVFGLIQGFANLGYALLAYWGKSLFLLVFTAFLENFCSGLGSTALVAMIMALCNIRFTATHFAILSAVGFIPRTIVGPIAAPMVEAMGWTQFFIVCTIISMPTLLFVYLNKQTLLKLRTKDEINQVYFDS